jgi:anti-sigma regulatory factor (Ser/Thr protein kinase)
VFVARILATAGLPGVDSDAATLLTSELVTNAILHTDSRKPGGTFTVVVLGLPDGALVEVLDDGSASTPVVKGDRLAGAGQGLFLVEQVAAQWGYLIYPGGTTVWFRLASSSAGSAERPRGQVPAAATTAAQIAARSSSLVT